jgi:hypothetical protein
LLSTVAETEAVWDGTGWVHPASGHRWDGQRWLEPTTGVASAPSPAVAGPSRALVLFHVAWRALVGSVVGGTLIVLAVIVFFLVRDQASPPANGTPTRAGDLVYALFGLVFGVVLGVPAGALLGGVLAWRGVPYRGARATRLLARVTALVLVLLFLVLFFHDPAGSGGLSGGDLALYAFIYMASLGGAWLLAGWTVRWYVRRMEPAPRRQ